MIRQIHPTIGVACQGQCLQFHQNKAPSTLKLLHQTVSFNAVKMAHLLTLPLEILHIICANLCRHCTSETVEPTEPVVSIEPIDPEKLHEACFKGAKAFVMDNARVRIAALSAMTQTCTTIQHIAQPYLYHFPCARAPAVSKLLLRTLAERPHLAQYINQLFMFDMECRDLESILRMLLRIQEYQDDKEKIT